jgi:GntP family gluconate:H+ symporter
MPNWPFTIWMVAITLVLGLVGGLGEPDLVRAFNIGFGRALGEFALILLPSFALAAAVSRKQAGAPEGITTLVAPFAGAGMICPDTAYAALSPIAGRCGLDVAFGAYAGFKLLFPAGPLIVATALGVASDSLMAYSFALLIPVWGVGVLWGRFRVEKEKKGSKKIHSGTSGRQTAILFAPFCLMALLLGIGWGFDVSDLSLIDFLTQPKGALLSAAVLALSWVPRGEQRDCLDTAVRRTGALLLIIGVASAFGAVLMQVVPLEGFIPVMAGTAGIIGLFLLTALFKLVQGSSMATFAAVSPVAAPLVAVMDVPTAAAVLAICAGSFVAILPNDSFYWLVRKNALAASSETRSITTLAVGACLQAVTALVVILGAVALGVVT